MLLDGENEFTVVKRVFVMTVKLVLAHRFPPIILLVYTVMKIDGEWWMMSLHKNADVMHADPATDVSG